MANKMLCIFILVETILIETIAGAPSRAPRTHEIFWRFGAWTEFLAGAHHGEFQPGDTLVFMYPRGQHNVIEVDKQGFDNCIAPPSAKAMTTGEDRVKLDNPGQRWFICGIGPHCKEFGMKIQIDVRPPIEQTGHIVGDEYGWNPKKVDFQKWAAKRQFDVGDKLVFDYKEGKHNVIVVDEAAYNQCIIPPQPEAYTSGHDHIFLKKPGKVGFISSIGDDCKKGYKLLVNVVDPKSKAPIMKSVRKLP